MKKLPAPPATGVQPILRVVSLTKTFHSNGSAPVQVLKNVSFDIMPGEFIAVVGPSGSGKSTLVHCLGTFEEPDAAATSPIQHTHKGGFRSIWADPLWYRQNFIGIVFQSFHLLPNLDVGQNVEIPLRLGHCESFTTDRAERRKLVTEALEKLGIDSKYEQGIRELSGGECQRAAIARALVKRPQLLLADEPTGNLDEKNKIKIIQELRTLAQGNVSVLMVTHDNRYADAYADRIIRLEDGIITSIEPGQRDSSTQTVVAGAATSASAPPAVPVESVVPDASSQALLPGEASQPPQADGNPPPTDDAAATSAPPPPLPAPPAAPVEEEEGSTGLRTTLPMAGGTSSTSQPGAPVTAPVTAPASTKGMQTSKPKAGGLLDNLRIPGCDQRCWDILSFATRDARESSVSLVSNVVAILFGTVLTGLLISLLVGTDRFVTEMMRKIPGIDAVHCWVDYSTGGEPITDAEYTRLKQWPGATFAVPNIQQFVTMYEKTGRDTVVTLTSAASDDPEVKRLRLLKGVTQLDPQGWDIILNERVATDLNNFAPLSLVGKTITLQLRKYTKDPGQDVAKPTTVIDYPVRVVGIVQSSPKDRVYASLNLVRFVRDFSTGRSDVQVAKGAPITSDGVSARTLYEGVRVHFTTPGAAEGAYAQMKKQLPSRVDEYWPGSEMNYLRDVQMVALIVLIGIGLITVVAGSISVFNTLRASVARKTREIGILLALGVARSDIFVIFLWQAFIVGVLAAIVGLVIVWPATWLLNGAVVEHWDNLKEVAKLTGGVFVLPPEHAICIFCTVVMICLLAAWFPSRAASRKRPMDALRDHGS